VVEISFSNQIINTVNTEHAYGQFPPYITAIIKSACMQDLAERSNSSEDPGSAISTAPLSKKKIIGGEPVLNVGHIPGPIKARA